MIVALRLQKKAKKIIQLYKFSMSGCDKMPHKGFTKVSRPLRPQLLYLACQDGNDVSGLFSSNFVPKAN